MEINKYPSINGLRAFSVILVVISHLSLQFDIFEKLIAFKWIRPMTSFLRDGQLGVNIFFVISGFLITSRLLQEEKNYGSISLKNFFIRRVLRIFPAYYFLLLIYLVIQFLGYISISEESWFYSATQTKYFNCGQDWYTAHFWSLSVEAHFYIFWPFIFLAGDKIRKFATISLILIVPLIRLYIYFTPVEWIGEFSIFTRIYAVSMGCIFSISK